MAYVGKESEKNGNMDKLQAGVKIPRRNNNFRHEDDTTLMAEIEGALKSLLMKVKVDNEKAGLKLNIGEKNNLRLWHLCPSLDGKEKRKGWKQ